MTRTRLPALLSLFALLLLPAAAHAQTTVADVADALLSDGLYVDPQADLDVDEQRVRAALADSSVQVYIAVLPEEAGRAIDLNEEIGNALGDDNAVLLVVTDEPNAYADQGSGADARGVFSGEAWQQARAQSGVTDRLVTFVQVVDQQAGGGSGGGVPGQDGAAASGGLSPLVLALLVLGVGGGGVFLYARTRRQQARALEDARADVESLHARLGSDVQLLSPGDDDVARQALADAAERYNATGALMAKADTPGEFAAARRTAIEGLTAARVVRERLGLDPGPELPMPPTSAPQLREPSRVQIEDQEYEGSPTYTPGRPHYYEGGYYAGRPVPGGWYATPFWQTLLLGSVLGGGTGRRRGGYVGGFGGGIGGFRRGGSSGRGGFGGFGGGGRGGGGW
jgi:hypothetical protein